MTAAQNPPRYIAEAPYDRARRAGHRAPGGEQICRWDGKAVKAPRISWCSAECVQQYLLRKDGNTIRQALHERDRGICAICLLDTEALIADLQRIAMWRAFPSRWTRPWQDVLHRAGLLPWNRDTIWDADHIVPVAEGGGSCGLDNFRTLCIWCHRAVTADLHDRLAMRRNPWRGNQIELLESPAGAG